MKSIFFISIIPLIISCSQSKTTSNSIKEENNTDKVEAEIIPLETFFRDTAIDYSNYSNSQWKQILTDQEYNILREKGTERSFTGEYLENKKEGIYVCKGCATPLFESKTKFKSGTGWPSFYQDIEGNVLNVKDNSYGMTRTENVCKTCKGHLGHVFNDGPQPTGLRYCINSLSLHFVPAN